MKIAAGCARVDGLLLAAAAELVDLLDQALAFSQKFLGVLAVARLRKGRSRHENSGSRKGGHNIGTDVHHGKTLDQTRATSRAQPFC